MVWPMQGGAGQGRFFSIFINSTAFPQTTVIVSQLISSIFCASLWFSFDVSSFLFSILANNRISFFWAIYCSWELSCFQTFTYGIRDITDTEEALMGCYQGQTQVNKFTLLVFKNWCYQTRLICIKLYFYHLFLHGSPTYALSSYQLCRTHQLTCNVLKSWKFESF